MEHHHLFIVSGVLAIIGVAGFAIYEDRDFFKALFWGALAGCSLGGMLFAWGVELFQRYVS